MLEPSEFDSSSNYNALIDSKLEKFEPVPALAAVESDSASADTILVSFVYLVILEMKYENLLFII